jgi:hypothetical protein
MGHVGHVMKYDSLVMTRTGEKLKQLVAFVSDELIKKVREESIRKLDDILNDFRAVTMDAKLFMKGIEDNMMILFAGKERELRLHMKIERYIKIMAMR